MDVSTYFRNLMISKNDIKAVQILEDLHKNWTPHEGQVEALMPVISRGFDTAFISCGRKWGKSDAAIYILWRHALTHPKSACYYIAPELTHGRELVWSNGRIKRFGPQHYVEKFLNNESRIVFKNGSFIKLVGSENWGAANGLTPDCVVYDEFKEFHPQFHIEMNPNRLVRKAPLIIIGTPPNPAARNLEQYMEYKEECEASNEMVYIRQPSWENPHIDKKWLEKEKARLIKNGDADIWFREYEAKIVPGGRSSIFPMFSREQHLKSPHYFKEILRTRSNKCDFIVSVDPATVSTFGGLVAAIDRHTKKIYILDEVYEKTQTNTSVRKIYPRIKAAAYKWNTKIDFGEDWFKVYDEHEAWFSNEVMSQYGVYFSPTSKNLNRKEDGINLIRDILTHNLVEINSDCVNLANELESMCIQNGKIDKRWTHLVDCFRYLLHFMNYDPIEAMEVKTEKVDKRRMYKIEDDLASPELTEDWTSKWGL